MMYAHYFHVVTFLVFVAGLIWLPLYLGALIRPRHPFREKVAIYECGEPTIGFSWVRYNIRFYTTALLFLLFDVEMVLLIPVALWLRPAAAEAAAGGPAALPWLILAEIGFFVGILLIGLAYAWRNGGLDWVKGDEDRMQEADAPREASEAQPILVGESVG